MFIINLAFSDLCMMTSMGVPVVANQFYARYWAFGPVGLLQFKKNSVEEKELGYKGFDTNF